MRKIATMLLSTLAVAGATTSCCDNPNAGTPMQINNQMTAEEIAAGTFTPEVMLKMGRINGGALAPDGATVLYTVTYYNVGENRSATALFTVPTAGGDPKQLTDYCAQDTEPRWNADGSLIYFMSTRSESNQIWRIKPDGSGLKQITSIEGGINGFGIAPTGNKLWYAQTVKVGQTAKDLYPDYPKANVLIYEDLMARHWNYWDRGEYSHIFTAAFDGVTLTEVKDIMEGELWDAPLAPYFDNAEIAWNNAGSQLAYTCKKLTGTSYATSTNSDIYMYDCASGETRNLTEGMPGYDKYPTFSPDDSMIAFTSMERAGNESDKDRLLVLNLSNGEKTYLTREFDYNAGNITWNGNDKLYFIAPIHATYQLCETSLTGPVKVLTKGLHDYISLSLENGVLVAGKTTLSMATELFSINPSDGKDTQLTFLNKHIYDNVKMGQVQERWIKTTDGKEMLTWVILPRDFDSTKQYPALLYCEGGPQSVVSQRWSYRWNFQLMAGQGYVVVAPNRRGLPSFGQEWLDQISGDYSGQNIKDYFSAIDNLKQEPWVDANRLGAVGASYGGYSVYFLAGNHQNRFKAFIAHCGMFNFESMYGATEELWFPTNDLGGAYWSDNATAKRSYANSPHKFVNNWNTPILIFVGLNDFRIPYTESLQAFTAARMHGVPAKLVAFEDEAHQVFKPQNALIWHSEFYKWLDKYLK